MKTTRASDSDAALKAIFGRAKKRLMRDSPHKRLRNQVLSELELVESACRARSFTIEQYIRYATLYIARRDMTMRESRRGLHGEKAAGVVGAANKRLEAAVAQLKAEKRAISPANLRTVASCTYRQANDWLSRPDVQHLIED